MKQLLLILILSALTLLAGCSQWWLIPLAGGLAYEKTDVKVIQRQRYYASAFQKPPYSTKLCILGQTGLYLHKATSCIYRDGRPQTIVCVGSTPPNFVDVARGDYGNWSAWYTGISYRTWLSLPYDAGRLLSTDGEWTLADNDPRKDDIPGLLVMTPMPGLTLYVHNFGIDEQGSYVVLSGTLIKKESWLW